MPHSSSLSRGERERLGLRGARALLGGHGPHGPAIIDNPRPRAVASRRHAQDQPKPKADCRHDLVSLGEVMLRLDPGEGRIHTARTFQVWEGGGEYNVARGLRRCFGLDTAVVTALVDNPVGRLVEDFICRAASTSRTCVWVEDDGVGPHRAQRPQLHRARLRRARRARLLRPRPHRRLAARSRATSTGTDDLRQARARAGSTPAASSPRSPRPRRSVAKEAMEAAQRHGTIVSYDLNYRALALEVDRRPEARAGGQPRARAVRRRDDRQRGGLHRRARLRGRGRGREPLGPRPRATSGG